MPHNGVFKFGTLLKNETRKIRPGIVSMKFVVWSKTGDFAIEFQPVKKWIIEEEVSNVCSGDPLSPVILNSQKAVRDLT